MDLPEKKRSMKIPLIITIAALLLFGLSVSIALTVSDIGTGWDHEYPNNKDLEIAYGPEKEDMFSASGFLYDDREPRSDIYYINRSMALLRLDVRVTWTDEPSDIGYINEPENFKLMVSVDGSDKMIFGENGYYIQGNLLITFIYGNLSTENVGRIRMEVELVYSGDQLPKGAPAWLEKDDFSNSYDLEAFYIFREPIS